MKKILTFLLLLTLVFSLSACSLCGNKTEKENKEKYEQALVLIEEGRDIEAYRLLYQAKEYSPAQAKIDEMLANDYSLQYRAAKIGYTVKFGRYEQDNDTTNGSEPIEWTVIKSENGKLMLLANNVLDCRKYYIDTPERYYTWAGSNMCDWLNSDFLLNAFLEGEREKICLTPVETYEEDLGTDESVNLKVFILSHEEYYKFDYTTIRQNYINDIKLSEYAKARYKEYGYASTGTSLVSNHFVFRDANEYGLYYLRGNKEKTELDYSTVSMFRYYNIRPVIWIEY